MEHGFVRAKRTLLLKNGKFVADNYESKGRKGMDIVDSPLEIDQAKIKELTRLALQSRCDTSFDIISANERGVIAQESVDQNLGSGFTISQRVSVQGYEKFLHPPGLVQQRPMNSIEVWDNDNRLMLLGCFGDLPTPINFKSRVWISYSSRLQRFLHAFENEYMRFGDKTTMYADGSLNQNWRERIEGFWSYLRYHRIRSKSAGK